MDNDSQAILKEILEQQKRTNALLEQSNALHEQHIGLTLALVEALAEEQDMESNEPTTYMDGTPAHD